MKITLTTALKNLSRNELERVSHAAMVGDAETIKRLLGQQGYDGGDSDDTKKIGQLVKKLR